MLPNLKFDQCQDSRETGLAPVVPAVGFGNSTVPTFAKISCSVQAASRNGATRFAGASLIGLAGAAGIAFF